VIGRIALLPLALVVAFAQLRPTNPRPINTDFADGEIGKIPTGWSMPAPVVDAGYRVELRRPGCMARFSTCAVYLPPREIGEVRAAELEQTFPAADYLGKRIRFAAWLRVDGPDRGDVEIRMRVDHADGRVEFFDSAEGPVHSTEWQRREVAGRVSSDAVSISIWARYHPAGFGWVSDPLFRVSE
jgi:hypothetical protein